MYYYPNNNAGAGYNPYQPQVNTLKGRPVSSLEEVRAAQIDFDGSLFVFPDIANKRIYTKQINLDGTASLNMYSLTQIPQSPIQDTSNFITREEFQEVISQLKAGTQSIPEKTQPPQSEFKF